MESASPRATILVNALLVKMMEEGKAINADVQARVGEGQVVRSGHVVDELMTSAGHFEEAVLQGEFALAMNAAVRVLFLARDLAIREDKIRIQAPASA